MSGICLPLCCTWCRKCAVKGRTASWNGLISTCLSGSFTLSVELVKFGSTCASLISLMTVSSLESSKGRSSPALLKPSIKGLLEKLRYFVSDEGKLAEKQRSSLVASAIPIREWRLEHWGLGRPKARAHFYDWVLRSGENGPASVLLPVSPCVCLSLCILLPVSHCCPPA